MDPPLKNQSLGDTDATRFRAPYNPDNLVAPSPLMQPTPTPTNWHPAKSFFACSHTCEHTNSQYSRRSKQLRECPLWPRSSLPGLLRHARRKNLHMRCTEDCPANPRQREPIPVRGVDQAEWTRWARVLFDELHDKLDWKLGADHPGVDFNRLDNWVALIPDDGGGGEDEEGKGRGPDRKRLSPSDVSEDGGKNKRKEERPRKRPRVYSSDENEDEDEEDARKKRPRRGRAGGWADYKRDRRTKRRKARRRISSPDSSDDANSEGDKGREWGKARWWDEDGSDDGVERDGRREKGRANARKRFREVDSDSEDKDEVDRRKRRKRKVKKYVGSPRRSEDRDNGADEEKKEKPQLPHNAQPPPPRSPIDPAPSRPPFHAPLQRRPCCFLSREHSFVPPPFSPTCFPPPDVS
ncbi:hypothetical protein BD779DRAFT_1566541, partial [Infundibulicybe gibba]